MRRGVGRSEAGRVDRIHRAVARSAFADRPGKQRRAPQRRSQQHHSVVMRLIAVVAARKVELSGKRATAGGQAENDAAAGSAGRIARVPSGTAERGAPEQSRLSRKLAKHQRSLGIGAVRAVEGVEHVNRVGRPGGCGRRAWAGCHWRTRRRWCDGLALRRRRISAASHGVKGQGRQRRDRDDRAEGGCEHARL